MKRTRFIILLLISVSTIAADAQSKKYKIDGKKCNLVEITDPGEFFSTYSIDEAEIQMLKAQKIKPALLDRIINNHTEEVWPAEFAKLDVRVSNPDKIKTYIAYKVATLDNDKCIIVIPAKYNKDAGTGWAPAKDIFLVVGINGIKE